MRIHTWAWLGWLTAGLTIVLSTRNPYYLLFLMVILLFFQSKLRTNGNSLPISTIRFAFTILFFSTIFNGLISKFGETVLFTIPKQIALVGGNITLEAIVYGAINGLVLVNVFTLFTIINQVLPVKNLIRLIPQAFQPVAVVTTIALTFIPATQRQFSAIKEAQAMRGQQLRKLRDWLPLFIPLLIGGLERALQIAEAMTARGYTVKSTSLPRPVWQKLLLPAALIFITGGFFIMLIASKPTAGWMVIALGLFCILALFFISGHQFKKTHYFEERWNPPSVLMISSVFFIVLVFLLPVFQHQVLTYEPYPKITTPQVDFTHFMVMLLLLLPLIWNAQGKDDSI